MKRLLFHSYHFPPIGGSGAQRPLRMARYLPELGYLPTVVTGGGATSDRWAPEDATLDAEVPAEIDVLRLPRAGEPTESGRWRGRAERWLRLEPPWAQWWVDGSVDLARPALAGADLIYCWMQPYASAPAAVQLAKESGKPWVADLGDPWAFDEMIAWPSGLHRRWEEHRMRRALSSAAAVVMSTPEAARRVRERFGALGGVPVSSIPNGFERADFEGPSPVREDGRFRIVHTGYLHTDLGRRYERFSLVRRLLGGRDRAVNVLTRSHVYLLEALERIARDRPDVASRVELHLAGVLSPDDLAVIERTTSVHTHGYLSHPEAVALMRSADLLFLPMHELPEGRRATIVPGKTYEYLASGTAILAAVPAGAARDLLLEAGNASVCRPSDSACLARAIVARAEASDRARPVPAPSVLERYDYRTLAAELAATFDAAVS